MANYVAIGPVYQIYVFRGTMASAIGAGANPVFPEAFGAYQRETKTRSIAGPYGAPVTEWIGPNDGRVIVPRAVYRRSAMQSAPGVVTEGAYGPWHYWCQSDSAEFRNANPVQMNRLAPVNAGLPMKTRYGSPTVLADGTQPLQPTSGDPIGLNEWTGEPTGDPQP